MCVVNCCREVRNRAGLSCFCPLILVGGDNSDPMLLFDMFLDGLLEKGWMRGAEIEACKLEYQSFVQEQRQLEWTSTKIRPGVGNLLTFCSSQAASVCGAVCIKYVLSPKM